MPKSFYDLDFWIEANQKRNEGVRVEYDKIQGKISNIIIIYSAISVFLIAIWKDFFKTKTFYKHFFDNINPWYFVGSIFEHLNMGCFRYSRLSFA